MFRNLLSVFWLFLVLCAPNSLAWADLPDFGPAAALVRAKVESGEVPGAVLLIEHQGRVAVREAYGRAALRPQPRALSANSIFDLASLTKPVATSTAIMMLVESGKIELDAPVSRYLTPFGQPDKAGITIRHLLTHTSGLAAGGAYAGKTRTTPQIVAEIAATTLKSPPGESFLYSDFSFLTLGAVVEAVAGQPLDQFCRERIFEPLGMKDTFFRRVGAPLEPQILARVAATTSRDDTPENRALVHDPTARALGGVAGNAGLFSTADDLARFGRMILGGGELDGRRLLKSENVRTWLAPQSPALRGERTLGWDMASPYSIRGALSALSFGHTGFTGTSMWIDPASKTFIILLTNAVHAQPSGSVVALRRAVSNAVAASLTAPVTVQTGLDVLVNENFKRLEGRKIGVVCNHTAIDRQGRHLVDLLAANPRINIVALFSPEHGIRGEVDAIVSDSKDPKTGLKIFSLYDYRLPKAQRYRPTPAMLAGIDTLVFDIQDIGARYYTYISTLGYLLEEGKRHNIRVVVLDRPNPLGGNLVEGPILDAKLESFAGYHTMPITHGLTTGELARLFNAERKIGAEVEVVRLGGWKRDLLFDATGLPWINPSPNMRSVRQAWLYAGVGFLETLPLSVGRGTDTPFEIIGAPWLDGAAIAADLNARRLPGVTFVPTRFKPSSSIYSGLDCGGVQIFLWDRATSRPSEMGIHLLDAIRRRHGDHLPREVLMRSADRIGNEAIISMLERGAAPQTIIASWQTDVAEWRKRRAPFLLYP